MLCATDIFNCALSGRGDSIIHALLNIDNFLYFTITGLASYFILLYILRRFEYKVNKTIAILGLIPAIILTISSFLSMFKGIVFTINDMNEYERAKFFLLQVFISYLYIITSGVISLYQMVKVSLTVDKKDTFLLTLLALFPISAGILQAVFEGTNLVWPATTLAFLILSVNLTKRENNFDYLTEVFNKGMFQTTVQHVIKKSKCDNPFVIIDIDNFKMVNDKYGHKQGDLLLQLTAKSLKEIFGTIAVIGRIGGDEFGVLIFKSISKEELIKKSNAFLKSINTLLEGVATIKFSCSMGISLENQELTQYPDLYQEADKALYLSKKRGRNQFTIYSSSDIVENSARPIMLIVDDNELNRVILSSYFEDKFNILEAKNGKEALDLIDVYKNNIACVLLDLIMPIINGYDFLDIVERDKKFDLKKIILISVEDVSDEMLHEFGVNSFI